MSNRTRLAPVNALALALVALSLTAPSPGNPAVDEPAGAEAAIRRLLDGQVDDWNRKDLDGLLKGYWQNPGVVFLSGSTRTDGFEATRKRYRDRYQEEGREMGRQGGVPACLVSCGALWCSPVWSVSPCCSGSACYS